MLSYEEALDFLTNTLHIKSVEKKIEFEKLTFLKEYTNKFHQFIPFQNLSILAQNPEERHLPTDDEIRADILSGRGSMCCSRGLFTTELLGLLGFNSFPIACSVFNVGKKFTHISTIVKHVQEDADIYLIEIGACYPSLEPIPLHQLPQYFQQANLEFKIVAEGDVIARYHRVHDSSVEWIKFYDFEIIPRDRAFIRYHQEPIYTQPGYGTYWYLQGVKLSLYPEDGAVTMNDNVLKILDKQTKEFHRFDLKDAGLMIEAVERHFPMLTSIDIAKAIGTWMKSKQEHPSQ